jgi:hypothetical protein
MRPEDVMMRETLKETRNNELGLASTSVAINSLLWKMASEELRQTF